MTDDPEVAARLAAVDVPPVDGDAATLTRNRLRALDFPGAGLGRLVAPVAWCASVQRRRPPRPFRAIRILLVTADQTGALAAGTDPAATTEQVRAVLAGKGPLGLLARQAEATVDLLDTGRAGPALAGPVLAGAGAEERAVARPVEDGPVLTGAETDRALTTGWAAADRAIDGGADLLVLASCGAGLDAAATLVLAAYTGDDPAGLLPRVIQPYGRVDDDAWIARCTALRDVLSDRIGLSREPQALLTRFGGAGLAAATGLLVGAAVRSTPVLVDGPVGSVAALLARQYDARATGWWLLPDHGEHPTTRRAADQLSAEPFLDLRLDLGEGATALALLPLLQTALTLADALPASTD